MTEQPHLVPLGRTGWSVWRHVLIRGAGFPADGLARFDASDCAAAADRYLNGVAGHEEFAQAHRLAVQANAEQVCLVAADPGFREAVTWQNPEVLVALDGLVAEGAHGARNVRRRGRENAVAGYWQRYIAKTETIGFFGPVCWGLVQPGAAGITASAGAGLVRERRVFLEPWAVAAYADRLVEDPAVRRWLAPVVPPHHSIGGPDGRTVLRTPLPPVTVAAADAALLARCDGTRTAQQLVAELLADPGGAVRTAADGYLRLENLVARGLLRWDADLPNDLDAEPVLRARLAAIGEDGVRDRALAGLDRLAAARTRVAAAAGDPARLATELSTLDAEFTALTGRPPRRRAGQAYAGRALCHEETSRNLDVTVGGALLDELAPALALVLQMARWLTQRLRAAYLDRLRALYDELGAERKPVRLADLWYLAQGMLFGDSHSDSDGDGERPVDAVTRELGRRFESLLGLDPVPGGRRLAFTATDLAGAVAAQFPAARPGFSAGRVHSPDISLCAASIQALARGEYLAVLGELHTAMATFDAALFARMHTDLAALRAALAADLGPDRLRPLYPPDYPRSGGRLAHALAGPTDRQLAFADAPGADRARVLPASAADVTEAAGALVVTGPDGHRWPLIEAFSALAAMQAADAFRALTDRPYTPRITIDKLVLTRETWQTMVGATGLAEATDPAQRYLDVRRWRARHGLPERVFVRVATELKPSYVDLTSPLYATRLCLLLRAARAVRGDDVAVVVTEALPVADDAWLPDAQDRRYTSELRLQVRDPAQPEGVTP